MTTRNSGPMEQSPATPAAEHSQLELRRRERYLDLAAKIVLARQIVLPRGPAGDASGSTEAMTHVADALRGAAHIWHDLTDDERQRAAHGLSDLLASLGRAIGKHRNQQESRI